MSRAGFQPRREPKTSDLLIRQKVEAMIEYGHCALRQFPKSERHVLSAEEMAEIARFNEVVSEARAAGDAARADMAVLNEVLAVEPAFLRLRQPELEPELGEDGQVINQDALDQDAADRMAAQSLVEGASVQVLDLLMQRNPPPPEPEVIEETGL